MSSPKIVVTGASGFLGRHLLQALESDYEIFALARRAPAFYGTTTPATVRWYQVDITEPGDLAEVFSDVRKHGPVGALIHLAGHYDFTGERSPEYSRTNVHGMRNVLEAARGLGVRDVVFASSVAACGFPRPGQALTELSPPDGDSPYAESKRAGEEMLREYRGIFRGWIVRFAALFSDWCEYEPVFRFLETWLPQAPRRRMIAGVGASAVPYLHVRDAVEFLRALLSRLDRLNPDEVLLASPDGATSHLELFATATAAHFGQRGSPILVPRPLCRVGLELRDIVRRTLGMESFERPWMGRYIDLSLTANARQTRERMGWAPRPRLSILRRMPFLVQNRKAFPPEWQRRNHAALKNVRYHHNLRVSRLLEDRAPALNEVLTAHLLDRERSHRHPRLGTLTSQQHRADNAVLIDALADAVRTGEKGLFTSACRGLCERRRSDGFPLEDMESVLDALNDLCVLSLAGVDSSPEWALALYDHITMTVQFGVDEVHEIYETAR